MNQIYAPAVPLTRAQRFGSAFIPAPPGSAQPRPSAQSQALTAPTKQDSFVGILERLTQVSPEFSIGAAYSDEREKVALVGSGLKDLVEGNEYTFTGTYKRHHKYGEQFDVVAAMPYLKPDRISIVKYIAKNFSGVGPTKAEKFITLQLEGAPDEGVALEEVRQQLLNAPWTLDFTGVAKKAKFQDGDEESPVGAYVHRDLATKLGGMPGIKDAILKSLSQYLLSEVGGRDSKKGSKQASLDPQIIQKCWAILVQDPYEPTRVVKGYGFLTADAFGASVNIPRDAPARIKALVAHALDLSCRRTGHTFLTFGELFDAVSKLDSRVPAIESIRLGLEADMIILDESFGDERYYLPSLLEAETELSMSLAKMCSRSRPMSKMSAEQAATKVQATAKAVSPSLKQQGLDPSQIDALVGILTSETRLHTLTAGPGCGKTQLMEVLSKVLEHKDIVFCGPTGKSAKVLTSRLSAQGREANTIHSTLAGAGRGTFRFNAKNPLEGDLLVVDESSMNDLELAEAITAAANSKMHLILLGDTDQLPSIAPGSFLKDVLEIKAADHHRLTKTHRNSGGILNTIEQIRKGQIDCVDLPSVKFSHGLEDASLGCTAIAVKYINAVSKYGYEHVALIMSHRAGDPFVPGWNTTYFNQILRDLCNQHALKIPGTKLYVGDRIIIRENMNVDVGGSSNDEDQIRVVNGDTGTITSFERDPGNPRSMISKSIRLKLDDGRLVDFPGADANLLQHSYALTVHSAQGSEYKKVIAVITPGHPSFMNRAMLFTGLSRAREELDINGRDEVIRKVAATPLPTRNSSLVERVTLDLLSIAEGDSGDEDDKDEDDPVDLDSNDGNARSNPRDSWRTPEPARSPPQEAAEKMSAREEAGLSLRQRFDMRARG